jgi:hypothetical protein
MTLPHGAGRRRLVCVVILAAAFALTLLFLAAEIRLLRSPFQRDYGEGHVLWLTMGILDAGSAYKPLDSLPYVVNPYTPLYMLAVRLVNLAVGDLLTAGRGLSLVCTLGIGLALALTVFGVTSLRVPLLVRGASAAFAGVLPFAMDDVIGWSSLMRVDMLALFLMYAGLGIYLGMGKRERWQHAAGIFFVLALLTKETMLSAPLACLSFGLLVDWRRTARVAATAGLLLAACVVYANTATHGGFLKHIVGYNHNPFSWQVAALQVYYHVRAFWPWFAIAAAAFLASWNRSANRLRSHSSYNRAVLVAGLNCAYASLLMVTAGKMGTTYNHFLAWDISTCLLCGLFLYRLLATWTASRKQSRVAVWACALLLAGILLPPIRLVREVERSMDAPDSSPDDEAVGDTIRQMPGPVFSENLLLPIQAGKPVQAEPATLTYLTLAGQWDEQAYVSLFQQQYFSLVVARDIHSAEMYSPAVAAAIDSAYTLRERIGPYSLYYPRARTEFR